MKATCNVSTEELRRAFIDEGKTLSEMCKIMGVKSETTASKLLRERGIETNRNKLLALKTRKGMPEDQFRDYITLEYNSGKSMREIAEEFGVTTGAIRKYLIRYGVQPRPNHYHLTHSPDASANWKGGRRVTDGGYIAVYCPDHPKAGKRRSVYEHILVVEDYIGRYLNDDECVHHIDGNKHNNAIENLLLMSSSDHMRIHAIIRRSKNLMETEHENNKK